MPFEIGKEFYFKKEPDITISKYIPIPSVAQLGEPIYNFVRARLTFTYYQTLLDEEIGLTQKKKMGKIVTAEEAPIIFGGLGDLLPRCYLKDQPTKSLLL